MILLALASVSAVGIVVCLYALGVWCGPIPLYVGQTVNVAARFYEHAQTIRSIPWTHWTFMACPEAELDQLERSVIRAYPWTRWLGFNRTDGNEK